MTLKYQQWKLLYEVCSRTLNHAPERGQRSSWGVKEEGLGFFFWCEFKSQEVSLTVLSSSITLLLLSFVLCSRDLRDTEQLDEIQFTIIKSSLCQAQRKPTYKTPKLCCKRLTIQTYKDGL